MQALILAAGRGTRMGTLTESTPKPLLVAAGRTLLEHKFDMLPEAVDEVVLVVGYHGAQIRASLGDSYNGRRITYVEQEVLDGTGGAVWKARPVLRDRFLVMMGDDIYARQDAERCLNLSDWSMLVEDMEAMPAGGRVIVGEDGTIQAIEEGDHRGLPGCMNTNLFVLDMRFFEHPLVPKAEGSSEYGLPQSVLAASKAMGIPLTAVRTTFWAQITSPEDILAAEARIEDTGRA
jgi:NDP-sugar pyrophosphorylase family protein